ncbi:hypothetical protein CEXT_560441 [Caerostris extrusa]|uniref:Uncharacterized protein n=1 Tax=Caerostris extrusa TaxID=172846 RepID=A0AAV4MN86_CAEEX|nr:hypothetical protein CEXT_560441 [Caerostris extrusa]
MMEETGYLEPQVYCSTRDIELAKRKISDSSERSINAASHGDFGFIVGVSKKSATRQGRLTCKWGKRFHFPSTRDYIERGKKEPPCERSDCQDDVGNGISGAAGLLLGAKY